MVKGFEEAFAEPVVRIFLDEKTNPFSHDALYQGPDLKHYSCMITVGPTALSYALDQEKLNSKTGITPYSGKIFYSMVFNPDKRVPDGLDLCGISLNIFSSPQVLRISAVFPGVRKIGVLFDPENNARWFSSARNESLLGSVDLVPLHVRRQSDVNRLYREGFENVDALLFIPDKTVTSPTIIRHVIKQSLARGIPVIGYNRFFHTSGAALSLVLDYSAIGVRMAEKVRRFLSGEPCVYESPVFKMLVNRRVVDLLRIKVNEDVLSMSGESQ